MLRSPVLFCVQRISPGVALMKVKPIQSMTEVLSATFICFVVMIGFHFQLLDPRRGVPCVRSPILRCPLDFWLARFTTIALARLVGLRLRHLGQKRADL